MPIAIVPSIPAVVPPSIQSYVESLMEENIRAKVAYAETLAQENIRHGAVVMNERITEVIPSASWYSVMYEQNSGLVIITGLLFVCIFHRVVFIFLAACLKLGVIAAFLYCVFLLGAAK